jgi:hypothetical protein
VVSNGIEYEGTINLFLVLVFVLCVAIIAYGILTGNPLPYMIIAVLFLMLAFYFASTLKLVVTIVWERIEKAGGIKFYTPVNWCCLTVRMVVNN